MIHFAFKFVFSLLSYNQNPHCYGYGKDSSPEIAFDFDESLLVGDCKRRNDTFCDFAVKIIILLSFNQ